MDTETVIKLFMILGIIYLLSVCLGDQLENFDQDIEKELENNTKLGISVTLNIKNSAGDLYSFVSFENFKPEIKKIIVTLLTSKTSAGAKIYNEYLQDKEPIYNKTDLELSTFVPTDTTFYKTPIFLIKTAELTDYATGTFQFKLDREGLENKYYLKPVVNGQLIKKNYVHLSTFGSINFLYHTTDVRFNDILTINSDGIIDKDKQIKTKYIKSINFALNNIQKSISILSDNGDEASKASIVFTSMSTQNKIV